jgi:hypothetical protein
MDAGNGEKPCVIVHDKGNPFDSLREIRPHLLQLAPECLSYLEQKIQIKSPISQNKIIDFNRLFGQPSRFWAVRLPNNSALLFLSSAAIRNSIQDNSGVLQFAAAADNNSEAAMKQANKFLAALKASLSEDTTWSTKHLISLCAKINLE